MKRSNQEIKEQIKSHLPLASPTIYEIISTDGKDEMRRPVASLVFSGIAAGIGISFSLFMMGYLTLLAPDAKLIIPFGYTIGFLIVIRSRFQLFTENTITPVLPLLENPSRRSFYLTLRLWIVVFFANLLGTFLAAFLFGDVGIATPEQMDVFKEISIKAIDKSNWDVFLTGIPAGLLLAATVWMIPSSRGQSSFIIIFMTYLIAIGGFSHVVAGSTEAFLLVLQGDITLTQCVSYIFCAAAGNILGGTGLFSMLAYAQIRTEV